MRVVVIGAGIVGSSVAYECAKAGATVLVLEARRIGGATSAVSFAWTNASGKRPHAYFALNVAGMRAHQELKRDFGGAPWLVQTGSIEWRTTPDALAEHIENFHRIKAWGYGVQWLDRKDLAGMEPDIDIAATGDGPIAYFSEEGWVDPLVYAGHLLRAASERWSLEVQNGAEVAVVETKGGRVTAVHTASGDRYPADAVVNCTGGWSGDALGDVPAIPMASTIGVLGFTPPVSVTLRSQFHADDLDVRPDGAGRLMIHKIGVDARLDMPRSLRTDSPEAVEMRDAARKVLPALRNVELEAIRTTVRPIPKDSLTCAGELPQVGGYHVAVTHSGVTLAPHLGRVLADEIVRGRVHDEMESFRPARFFN